VPRQPLEAGFALDVDAVRAAVREAGRAAARTDGSAAGPAINLIWLCNPNNPTATIVTADEVERFMARVPERTIAAFDEAYIEFALGPDFPDTLNYVKQGRKVVVLRTFSKAASLAGLRVGYGIADADAVALMNRIRQPFNVNSLAQAAALAALDDDAHTLECVRMIEAGRHSVHALANRRERRAREPLLAHRNRARRDLDRAGGWLDVAARKLGLDRLERRRQRAALAFAEAVTATPTAVTDSLFEPLRVHFTVPQIVELAVTIATEHFRAKFNTALGIQAQGLCLLPPP